MQSNIIDKMIASCNSKTKPKKNTCKIKETTSNKQLESERIVRETRYERKKHELRPTL